MATSLLVSRGSSPPLSSVPQSRGSVASRLRSRRELATVSVVQTGPLISSPSRDLFSARKHKSQTGGTRTSTRTYAIPAYGPTLLPYYSRGASISFDFDAALLARYVGATVLQFALLVAALKGFDVVMNATPDAALGGKVGTYVKPALAWISFAFLAVKSRTFAFVNAARPDANTAMEKRVMKERVRPSWQPPGFAFGIIWSTIGLLRATSCLMIYQTVGTTMCWPFLAILAHLCIGDTWNAVNNADGQLGFSVLLVWFGVHISAWNVVKAFYLTNQSAGFTILPMACWLTIAPILVTHIWLLNPAPNGKRYPLYPVRTH